MVEMSVAQVEVMCKIDRPLRKGAKGRTVKLDDAERREISKLVYAQKDAIHDLERRLNLVRREVAEANMDKAEMSKALVKLIMHQEW